MLIVVLIKLLISVNCQTTVAFRVIHSFHFLDLWVCHAVNYIISPQVRIRHFEKGGSSTFSISFSSGSTTLFTLWPYLSELPKSCQERELTFLSTVGFRATKFLWTVRVDIPADRSFQKYQNLVYFKSWYSCSFHSYLTLVAFEANKIQSAVGVDIPVSLNSQSYQNHVSYRSWHSF